MPGSALGWPEHTSAIHLPPTLLQVGNNIYNSLVDLESKFEPPSLAFQEKWRCAARLMLLPACLCCLQAAPNNPDKGEPAPSFSRHSWLTSAGGSASAAAPPPQLLWAPAPVL